MILVVTIAATAVFYNHLEVGMSRRIRGYRSVLAWIHLVGMNVYGAATTITMIFAGITGSGILGPILERTGATAKHRDYGPIHPSNCYIYSLVQYSYCTLICIGSFGS
ncbi:MAG TPA: hypothetical protein VE692_05425 [Nitrososphaera sp.]|jgi:hypothetical protein|nr:hypothetical protein [Nitrososphaera sp.]